MIDIDIIGQLLPNPVTMLVQLCSTLVLFLVVKRFLWNSVVNMLDKRSEAMQSELNEAEMLKKQAEMANEEAKKQLKEASDTSKMIVAKAENEGKAVKEQLLASAKKEAEDKLASARREIEYEKKQMRSEMISEMVEVAMVATEKLIQEKADAKEDQAAIERFVKEISELHEPVN